MRTKLIILFFIGMGTLSYAQKSNTEINQFNPDKRWIFDIMAGANIDLTPHSSNVDSKLLGTRPDVAPALGIRISHLFSQKLGGYARINMNWYKTKKSDYVPSSIVGDIFEVVFNELFKPVSMMRPAADAGVFYRFEQQRWNLAPSIGVGYMSYLPERESSRTRVKDDITHTVSYKQHASPLFVNFGLSTRYYFSNKRSLVLDVNYQQPLQKSHAELITQQNGVETERKSYETSTAGQNIHVSLGYGITF